MLSLSLAAQMPTDADTESYEFQQLKLAQFFDYLEARYVDTLDNENLVEAAIRGMLAELDPHSSYSSPEEMKSINESFGGSFSGIGVEFDVISDTIIVVNAIPGGPAENAGMAAGDRIVTIDGKPATGLTRADVPSLLRGAKGSRTVLGVVRRSVEGIMTFTIIRDDIPIHTIDAAYMIRPGIGYIKVNRFANNTMREFMAAFRKLGRVNALILDLRGNGGGLMDQAIRMSEFFLPAGSVIVSTEGRSIKSTSYRSPVDGMFTDGMLTILIDSSSASGSEIVAGAVQDWDRGVIIGQPSFGKGLVQQQLSLIDGSAVRITVARYHTPSGRVIQRPFEYGDAEGYYIDHIKRSLDRAYIDSLNRSAQSFRTLRNGRKVLGGGGIYPDVTVQIDTTRNYSYWNRLVGGNVVNEYVNTYLESERERIEAEYPVFEKFEADYTLPADMLENIAALGAEYGITRESGDALDSLPGISSHIKALIARKIWDTNEYFRIINSDGDRELDTALAILASPAEYDRLLAPPAAGKK